ncbi:hypothetical protein ACQRIT_003817 [Beauveria bassiana]
MLHSLVTHYLRLVSYNSTEHQPWSSIDRLFLKVLAEKYQKMLGFDTETLQSLNYELRHSVGDVAGRARPQDGPHPASSSGRWPPWKYTLRFAPTGHALVDALDAATLAGDGSDNGAPGTTAPYTHYPDDYAAYMKNPVGSNIEAVQSLLCDSVEVEGGGGPDDWLRDASREW